MKHHAASMYADALRDQTEDRELGYFLRFADGSRIPLSPAVRRWCGTLDATDRDLLQRIRGAVLDVGCGPGRFVAALTRQQRVALGVDIVETAVVLARRTGGAVLHRSVFDRLPGEGRWGSVLLLDGNVGIGGDPERLLVRCRQLLAPGGSVLVELNAPDGQLRRGQVRLETYDRSSSWFDWATVSATAIDEPATAAGLAVRDRWNRGDRWFAELAR
jgi:SAM-dependent methyltransferase